MNTIQQLSLKIQLGIDPSNDIQPERLRAMWRKDRDFRYGSGWIARREKAAASQDEHKPHMPPMR
jgi:hypothetical protein